MKSFLPLNTLIILFLLSAPAKLSAEVSIHLKPGKNELEFGNSRLRLNVDYDHKCVVSSMLVNNEAVLSETAGIYTEVRTRSSICSSRQLSSSPEVETGSNFVTVRNIRYRNSETSINETWKFIISETDIRFEIERVVDKPFQAEEVSFPAVGFKSIHTWEGAVPDFGGLAWFYLFNEPLCTYGVHSGSSIFWNSRSGNGLRISAASPGRQLASKFSRSETDQLFYSVSVSDQELNFRYDAGTNRRRFIRQKTDVWDAILVPAGTSTETLTFSWFDYNQEFSRGKLVGINGGQVSSLLNTIARIGVIDKNHFGGNSWHTPYGPICLHEQYIAQLGIAINDSLYLEGYKQCLDYYRDKAIQPDGRVLPRWAYDNSDAMTGTATAEGFYEAQWGYLLDSNPDFVTNVAELYDQCGDMTWVKGQKTACENALDYLLRRDSNGNHLVKMMSSDHTERRGSDWIDIIWASFENALINAKLYYALTLWSGIEQQLGDTARAGFYRDFASGLKTSFNKPTSEGGFWDVRNQWYVHWLDKDLSAHGNNLVVPVNFMAIAYGLCDSEPRKIAILSRIEEQMEKEKLFAWPLCMYSYEKDEGNDWQFPFPNYENGDIFLSWGALGVEAFASSNPELALKYINNILSRYEKDGLAFQRYTRKSQEGAGDDILAGNSLALIGLYKSIYGINPKYNRMYLNPHLPAKMEGTELRYTFRGEKLTIGYEKNRTEISNRNFSLVSRGDFGFFAKENEMEFFSGANETYSLSAEISPGRKLSIEIQKNTDSELEWKQEINGNGGKVIYRAAHLKPGRSYAVSLDNRVICKQVSNSAGQLSFEVREGKAVSMIEIKLL